MRSLQAWVVGVFLLCCLSSLVWADSTTTTFDWTKSASDSKIATAIGKIASSILNLAVKLSITICGIYLVLITIDRMCGANDPARWLAYWEGVIIVLGASSITVFFTSTIFK